MRLQETGVAFNQPGRLHARLTETGPTAAA